MPSLAEFQRSFAATLLAPSPDDSDHLHPGARIHRNTVIKGLVDALVANYPTLGVLMGAEWLAGAAREYALQNPPQRAALADYGESFPDYLLSTGACAGRPYLQGVAELDRAWTRAFLAPDVTALSPGRLAALAPDALSSLQLRLQPGASYGIHAQSAATVWRANRPPAMPPAELCLDGSDEAALMLRTDNGVTLLPLDAAGSAFISTILAGGSIAAAAGAALTVQPEADVASLWSTLLVHGAFSDPDTHGP